MKKDDLFYNFHLGNQDSSQSFIWKLFQTFFSQTYSIDFCPVQLLSRGIMALCAKSNYKNREQNKKVSGFQKGASEQYLMKIT